MRKIKVIKKADRVSSEAQVSVKKPVKRVSIDEIRASWVGELGVRRENDRNLRFSLFSV